MIKFRKMSLFKCIACLIIITISLIACTPKNPTSPKDTPVSQTPASKPIVTQINDTNIHKYSLISGIVKYETNILGNIGNKTLYFDDYGRKEREDYYEDNKLRESVITNGKTIYKVRYIDKIAFNMGIATRGIAYRFDWKEVPEKQKKDGFAIKTEMMNIAGKQCESYKIDNSGIITIFAGWDGVCLYTMQQSSQGSAITKAISIDVNAAIPSETFKLPKGIRVK